MAAHIARVVIENFRNFEKLDINLAEQTVLVGENKAGKSNFIHALRLVLDPTLPDSMRILRREDFWDGLDDPMEIEEEIKIEIYFEGFEDNEKLLALLSDYLVEEGVAKITYLFKPVPILSNPSESSYHFKIFGGDSEDENRFGSHQRAFMPLEVLPALRDAEGDLYSWPT
jgi:putative ATP-dependent endonuclease of OLD family